MPCADLRVQQSTAVIQPLERMDAHGLCPPGDRKRDIYTEPEFCVYLTSIEKAEEVRGEKRRNKEETKKKCNEYKSCKDGRY